MSPLRIPAFRGWDAASVIVLALAVGVLVAPEPEPEPPTEAATRIVSPIRIPAFSAGRVDSVVDRIPVPGQRTLLYVFRSDCPACERQKPEWTSLALDARAEGWRVVALTAEARSRAVDGFFEGAPVEVLRPTDPAAAARHLVAPGVPTTLAVRADGTVSFHRVGVMSAAAADSLRQILAASDRD